MWAKRLRRRSGALVLYLSAGAALMLPALALLVFATYHSYTREFEETEREARDAAEQLILLSDARVQGDLAALRLLSGSRAFHDRTAASGSARAREAINLIPGWKAVILSDRTTGEITFEVSVEGMSRSGRYEIASSTEIGRGIVGGVARDGHHCPCVHLHISIPGAAQVLTAIVDPRVFQEMLLQVLPPGALGGMVDRDGEFLARSLDYDRRVGTPGTSFVLDAVRTGGSGLYVGTTYEGMTNYTAYMTSELTGWSGHIAVDSALLDAPRRHASAVLIGSASVAIGLAALLFLAAAREVARSRAEEQRLLELQRAEAVSQFMSTVVHDFRNVVATLKSGLNLIRRKTRNEEIKEHVAALEQSIERGNRLVNRLLSFAQGSEADLELVDIRKLLGDAQFLIDQALGRAVDLVIEAPADECLVLANRDQLELALLNLAINARDAMDGHGRLRIETRRLQNDIEIRVSDTGPGVPVDQRQAIFAPFHTTKPWGTGLGLAQVTAAARHAGGRVHVEDAKGGGACFVVTLPRMASVEICSPAR